MSHLSLPVHFKKFCRKLPVGVVDFMFLGTILFWFYFIPTCHFSLQAVQDHEVFESKLYECQSINGFVGGKYVTFFIFL